MRGDAYSRSSYYQTGIQNGWLTRNEARIAESLNPLEGLDEPLRPLNMVEEGSAEDVQQAQILTQRPAEPDDDETSARMQALVATSAARLARRIHRAGKVGENDIALIADALAVPVGRVNDWAQALDDLPMAETELTDSLISLGTRPMKHKLLIAEFLAAPWAMMPERLNAVGAVIARWSQLGVAGDDVMQSVQADRAVRESRRQATSGLSSGGIAVLPLHGVVTQRGNMVEDVSGPGSVSTQQFASALRQALADDTVSQILIDIDSPGGSV